MQRHPKELKKTWVSLKKLNLMKIVLPEMQNDDVAKDKDMQQRPFDKDDKATGADIMKGKKNIVLQLKKTINLGGSLPVTFDGGRRQKS